MTQALHERLRRLRFRLAQRRLAYRQRDLAAGVWLDLQRLLADAAEAYFIDAEQAEALAGAGHAEEPAGAKLEPPKRIFVLDDAHIANLRSKRRVTPRLDSELLAARYWVLRPFDGRRRSRRSASPFRDIGLDPVATAPVMAVRRHALS